MKVSFEINRVLSEGERDRHLTAISDEGWNSVRQFLLKHIEEATQIAIDPGTAREHGSVAYYTGQIAAIRLVFAQMEEIRRKNKDIVDDESIL